MLGLTRACRRLIKKGVEAPQTCHLHIQKSDLGLPEQDNPRPTQLLSSEIAPTPRPTAGLAGWLMAPVAFDSSQLLVYGESGSPDYVIKPKGWGYLARVTASRRRYSE